MNTAPDRAFILERFEFLCLTALGGAIMAYVFASANAQHLLPAVIAWDALLFGQLFFAWKRHCRRIPYAILYILAALFVFRLSYWMNAAVPFAWAMRVAAVHIAAGWAWHLFGVVALHPTAWSFARRTADRMPRLQAHTVIIGLIALGAIFWLFRSNHITRDGLDWIQRTTLPVWHLYLREPLTIGLYRLAWLGANLVDRFTPRDVIASLSIVSGIASVWFYTLFVMRRFKENGARLAALLLAISCGGWSLLAFGHIEVYPILTGGLAMLFYVSQRYIDGDSPAWLPGLVVSLCFLMHLSTGWLLPGLFLLPFLIKPVKAALKDSLAMGGTALALQAAFWLWLIAAYYQADLSLFLARLHETFNVGPDRGMFTPSAYWLHPWRLWDLFNEYLYLIAPVLILTPALALQIARGASRSLWFWGLMAGFYFAYSFCWNPDRGFPEDWDLFSPMAPVVVLLFVNALIDDERAESWQWVYLVSAGMLPYAISQIVYHHLVSFRYGG